MTIDQSSCGFDTFIVSFIECKLDIVAINVLANQTR